MFCAASGVTKEPDMTEAGRQDMTEAGKHPCADFSVTTQSEETETYAVIAARSPDSCNSISAGGSVSWICVMGEVVVFCLPPERPSLPTIMMI